MNPKVAVIYAELRPKFIFKRGRHLVVDEQLQLLVLGPVRFRIDLEGLKVAVVKRLREEEVK